VNILAQAKELFGPPSTGPAPPPAPDDFERFEKFLNVADRLAGLRGGGKRGGWDLALDFARELGPTVVQPVCQLIANGMMLRNSATHLGSGVPAGAPPAVAFDPYRDTAARNAAAAALNRPPAPAQPSYPASYGPPPPMQGEPQTGPAATASAPPNELAPFIQAYGGLIVQHLNMGTPGYIVGEWLSGLLGNAAHAQIAALGEPALLAALMTTPEIAIFGQERLTRFVHEFVNFTEFADDNNDDDEDARVAEVVAHPAAS
jgi:hypothetical protein